MPSISPLPAILLLVVSVTEANYDPKKYLVKNYRIEQHKNVIL